METRIRLALLILMVAGLTPFLCYGQVPQGQMLGIITDASGAVVPGATVTLKNENTGIESTTKSSPSGGYTFLYLDSGLYTVTAQKEGFTTTVSSGIVVQVEETKRVNVQLRVGATTTQVAVSGTAAKVDTDTATIGTIVTSPEVIGLPLNGREFSLLALTTPGTLNEGTTGGALITSFATAVQVGGTNYGKNAYTVDGADNTFNVWNGPAMNPSIDSIQEFRIDRSQFTAEYGRGGAEMELVTKTGSNQFHGTFWEYLRNADLDAGDYVTHQQDTLKRNQYGANIGGLIRKDKAFFFFNWEGQRQHSTVQPLGTTFTALMRTGNLSQFPTPIIDPQTGSPFPGNVIPSGRLDTVALAYMNAMIANPDLPGASGGVLNNFVRPFTTILDWDQYVGRVDYQVSPKDSLLFRFDIQPRSGIDAPLTATSVNSTENMHFYNGEFGWTRAWTPRVITQTRLAYHGEFLDLENGQIGQLPSSTITGFDGYQPPQNRLPILSISPYYTFAEWNFPWRSAQHAFQLISNATMVAGKHTVKVGFDGRHQIVNRRAFGQDVFDLSYTGAYTGNGVADYLLGLPLDASESLPPTDRYLQYGDYAAFVQDDWKLSPSLTVNLGLRYEIQTQPTDRFNRQSGFDPNLEKIVVAGNRVLTQYVPPPLLTAYAPFLIPATQTNLPSRSLIFGDHNDFAPRVGFAWRPFKNNKTVVRGGYGVYYLLGDGNIDGQQAVSAIPYGGSVSAVNTTPAPTFTMDAPLGAGVSTPPPPGPHYYDPNRRDGYVQQTSIGGQRELPWGMVAEVDVQDQNSLKLESSWNLNQVPAGGSGPLTPREPYPLFSSSLTVNAHEGHARYDALEFSVRKTAKNVTFDWNHTWAKDIGRINVVDPYDRDEFYGPLSYVPNLDKLSVVAHLPFGNGQHWSTQSSVLDALAGGWTVAGLGNLYEGGQPYTIAWTGDPSGTETYVAFANRICNGSISNPTPQEYFNTSCFAAPTPGTFGNSGTGILFGPHAFSYDMGIYKTFRLSERTNLQFRSEFFNVFNHESNVMPQATANGADFGEILTKTDNPRVIQFALRLAF